MAISKQLTTVKIDAEGKSVGRIATEVAKILQGKHKASYEPQNDNGEAVEVRNAAKVHITGRKLENKVFYHYSGYPGGMRATQLKTVMAKNPADAVLRAVKSMLPKNRQRKDRLKRLIVHND
ncbi:MAG: 50S ribosomal protein L13 [Patescibacteria group bacterium]